MLVCLWGNRNRIFLYSATTSEGHCILKINRQIRLLERELCPQIMLYGDSEAIPLVLIRMDDHKDKSHYSLRSSSLRLRFCPFIKIVSSFVLIVFMGAAESGAGPPGTPLAYLKKSSSGGSCPGISSCVLYFGSLLLSAFPACTSLIYQPHKRA